MRRVHFLIDRLDYTAQARQATQLAASLSRAGEPIDFYSLNGPGPLGQTLSEAGVPILGRRGNTPFAIDEFLMLRRLAKQHPGGMWHVFGFSALQTLLFATVGIRRGPIFLSISGHEHMGPWQRYLLKLVNKLIVPHAQALTVRDLESFQVDTAAVPYGVDWALGSRVPALSKPPATLRLVAQGSANRAQELFEVVWAFEILRFVHPQVDLTIIADGENLGQLQSGIVGLAPNDSRVKLVPRSAEWWQHVAVADAVVTPQALGGINTILEAFALGKPVIAAEQVDSASLIQQNRSGLLYPKGDKPALAKAMQRLIEEPGLGDRLCAQGLGQLRGTHDLPRVVERWRLKYSMARA